MSKKESKKIPFNNYIKVGLAVVVVVFGSLILRNWYIGSINYELNVPIITETLISEVNTDEVYNYVRENENTILYMGVVNDENCRNFEREFNVIITRRSLEDTITYLNISKVKSKSKFIKEFNKFYDAELKGYPSLIIFEEGEVKATLTVKTGKQLDIEDVIEFLDKNGVVSTSL